MKKKIKLELTELELSELYTAVYHSLDGDYPEHLRKLLEPVLDKLNKAMATQVDLVEQGRHASLRG